jgi:hypothetical protein
MISDRWTGCRQDAQAGSLARALGVSPVLAARFSERGCGDKQTAPELLEPPHEQL